MTAAALDLRGTSDEELLALYRSDEDAATAALAEAARRDRTDRAAAARAAIRAEWYDAAYAQFLQAEAVCRGNLLSREGLAAGIADPFSLWHGPAAVAMKYASEELRDLWMISPRITITEYERQRAMAQRGAREDTITTEGITDEQRDVDADRRPGLDADAGQRLRPGDGAGADESVRPDRGANEAGPGPATGPIQRGGQVMGILEGVRVAEHMARAVAGSSDANQRQTVPPRVRHAGTVAVPASQAPVRPPAEPIRGDRLADLADAWIGKHCYLTDSARHAIALWTMAQHFRSPDERRVMIWDKFPHLLFIAETPGSGKTTTMKVAGYLCAPYYFGIANNPTAAGVCMTIAHEKSVVCVDEAHRIIGPKGTRKADVVTIMCASFEQDGTYLNARGGKANRVPVYAPMMIAAKKDPFLTSAGEEISDVIERSHLILMSKPPEDTELAPVTAETRAQGKLIGEKMAQWAAQRMADKAAFSEATGDARAAAAEIGLTGRDADVWLAQMTAAALCSPGHLQAACDAALELRLNQPAPKDEDDTDPFADLEASLADGAEIPGWG